MDENDLVYRLKKRAEIRREITTRKSVQEGKPDRIADILDEAATEIERLRENELTLQAIKVLIPDWKQYASLAVAVHCTLKRLRNEN